MRLNPLTIRPVLAGCALLAATSCSTDEQQTEAGLAPSVSHAVSAVPAYDIMKVSSLTVDGNLSEWANIPAISMADNSGRAGGLDNTAQVKLAWDNTYLYAAYEVTDTELLAAQTARDHGDIYQDDAVELYLDPQGDGSTASSMTATDYQFLANVQEALGDLRGNGTGGKDASFNASSFLAQAVPNGTLNGSGADAGYTVELRISWSDLGVTPAAGHSMRLDLAVDDDDTGNTTTEEFDWAGLTSSFNNPSGWKEVQLVSAPPPESAYDIVRVGSLTVDGNLSDWAGIDTIAMADDPSNGRGADNNQANVRLAWNNTYLYLAYDVSDIELLAAQTARDNPDIYKDDEVELYIDPQGDGSAAPKMTPTDYHFLANVRNALGDNKGTSAGGQDASYNAAGFLAKAVTNGTLNAAGADVGYTVEARIAWTDLGVTPAAGNFMRIDLAVGDDDSRETSTQEFDWAGLTSFNNPSGWKYVRLVTDATAPAAPTNVVLTVVSSSRIDVSWTGSTSSDVNGYKIYRATTGTPTLLTTVPGSPYQNTGLTAGTTYKYQVSAVDAAGNESPRTAEKSATTSGGSGGSFLRVGLFNLPPSTFGDGPGRDASGPIYRQTNYNPSPTSIASDIALADQHDILLVVNLAGSRGNWLTNGVYDAAKYEQRVRRFTVAGGATAANAQALTDAIARRRVVLYAVDEANHPDFNNTLSPTEVNDMGRLHKQIWPGGITIVRMSGTTLTEGWAGQTNITASTFNAIDYGWAQRSGQHNGQTLAAFFAQEKSLLASLNMGMVPGLNWWAGGLKKGQDQEGVTACWDTHNNGTSSGYIVGIGTNTSSFPEGTKVACNQAVDGTIARVVPSPEWIRRWADAVTADTDAPFVALWTYPYDTFSDRAWTMPLETRSDYVAAMDYAITKAGTRSSWSGWRTAK